MLHGFMQDEKWYEDLGHIVLGLLPIDLLLWVREEWQLPPETNDDPVVFVAKFGRRRGGEYWAAARVRDMRRDQLGYAIGQQLRVCLLVGLLWWRW